MSKLKLWWWFVQRFLLPDVCPDVKPVEDTSSPQSVVVIPTPDPVQLTWFLWWVKLDDVFCTAAPKVVCWKCFHENEPVVLWSTAKSASKYCAVFTFKELSGFKYLVYL